MRKLTQMKKEFEMASTSKTLPEGCKIAHVEEGNDKLVLDELGRDLTWKKIVDSNDLEHWILRQNKKHHQQVYADNSLYVSEKLLDILGDDGTGEEVEDLLTGNIDTDELDLDKVYTQCLKMLQMTPKER